MRFAIGTPPKEMAARINLFLAESTSSTLSPWWASWRLNLMAIPLLLVVLVFLAAGARWLLRTLGAGDEPRRTTAS